MSPVQHVNPQHALKFARISEYSGTAMAEPDKKFLRPLVERIKGGGCVLLIGPGVAVDTSQPDRPTMTSLLARRLAADPSLQGRCPPEMESNLRYVAELHYESNRNLEDLAIITADFYQGLKNTTTPFHRHLAELPFRLCIDTSPDDFMLEAFLATGRKKPASAHYNFRTVARNPFLKAPSEAEPLVYYLYGHSRDLYSLVLRESDLIEFLIAIVRGDPPLPDYIKGRLGDPETTFLFVGFGFQNWYLRVLLHVLKIYGHKSRAVALEDTGFFRTLGAPRPLATSPGTGGSSSGSCRGMTLLNSSAQSIAPPSEPRRPPHFPSPGPVLQRPSSATLLKTAKRSRPSAQPYRYGVSRSGGTNRTYAPARTGIECWWTLSANELTTSLSSRAQK